MTFDFDTKLWKGIADEAGMNAVFHPQSQVLRSWLPAADQPPEEHPALEVAGALVFLYVDRQLQALRLSLHLDEVIGEIVRANGTVPLRVNINDTTVFDDTDTGAKQHTQLLTPLLDADTLEPALRWLVEWAKTVHLGTAQVGYVDMRAAATLFLHIDEQLTDGGHLPRSWNDAWARPLSPEDADLPVAEIEGDSLVCPMCRAKDQIQEEDRAVRWNDLSVRNGAIFGGLGATNFEHSRFTCRACDADLALPSGVEDHS